jgi:GntR family transcriptional regulator
VAAQRPISALLGVHKGAPLFRMESISYLQNVRPLKYYVAWHRGDRSKFEMEMVVGAQAAMAQRSVRAGQ